MLSRLRRLRTKLSGPVRLPVGLVAAVVCLAVAGLYAVAVPAPVTASPVQAAVLRWAHPLVWAVLAGVCLGYAFAVDRDVRRRLTMLALTLYLVFLLVLVFS